MIDDRTTADHCYRAFGARVVTVIWWTAARRRYSVIVNSIGIRDNIASVCLAGINAIAATDTIVPVNAVINTRNLDRVVLTMRYALGAIAAGFDINLMIDYRYINRILGASI